MLKLVKAISYVWLCAYVLVSTLSGCAQLISTKKPQFEIEKITLTDGYQLKDDVATPLHETKYFTPTDKRIVCLVQYANLTHPHYLRWEWRGPNNIRKSSANHKISASPNTYIEKGSSIHHIPITAKNGQSMVGNWQVSIFLDDNLHQSLFFNLISDPFYFGKFHALLIGNNNYHDHDLGRLHNAIHDARVIAETLQNNYRFETKILENATRNDILTVLAHYRRELTENDNLLIYYSGHGWLDEDADTGYWLPVDSAANNNSNWISNSDITAALRAMQAKHILVVADSCYSGKIMHQKGIGIRPIVNRSEYIKRLAQNKSRSVISSGGLEPVYDDGGKGDHSAFAAPFIDILRNNSTILEATDLFQKLRYRINLNAPYTPEFGDIRVAGHQGGEFIFMPIKDS